ncbi:hypothetical protein Tco_1199085 [Tanacetum coccineum]
MVTLVDGVHANGVVMIFEMDIAFYAIQGTEILSLMIQLRILSIILPIFHTHLHNPNTCHTLRGDWPEDRNTRVGISYHLLYDDDEDDEDLYHCKHTRIYQSKTRESLIMEDEHLDTIPETESDEVIKYSVENLVQIPSESEGIPDKMRDVPFRDNSPPLDISKDQFEDFSDSNDDSTSIDDDSFSIDDIDYVEASPPDSELVSLETVEIVIPEVGWIDTDILLTIKDDILHEKLLNVNLLIAKIEALKDNPTPSSYFVLKSPIPVKDGDSFLEKFETTPELETFKFDIKEKNSGSTTIHAGISLSDLECFYFKSKPDPGELTSIVDSRIRENVLCTTNVNLPKQGASIARIFEASRARGFVLRSLELQILNFILGIQYPNLID